MHSKFRGHWIQLHGSFVKRQGFLVIVASADRRVTVQSCLQRRTDGMCLNLTHPQYLDEAYYRQRDVGSVLHRESQSPTRAYVSINFPRQAPMGERIGEYVASVCSLVGSDVL